MSEDKHRTSSGFSPRTSALGKQRARRSSPWRFTWEVLLTVGAVLGLLCLLASIAAAFFGITPIIFRSGSMGPEIDTGALALTRPVPASEVSIGDVVSVPNAQGQRVTHRIVAIDRHTEPGISQTDIIQLRLKGDANALPDPQAYGVQKVDLVFFSANGLGYVVAFLQTPWAIFAGGLLAGVLVFIAFRPKRINPQGRSGTSSGKRAEVRPRAKKESVRRVAGVLAVLLLPLSGLSFTGLGQNTLASFTDSSVATGGTLRGARLMDITGGISCKDNFPNSTITWNPAPFLPPEGSYALKVTRLNSSGAVDKEMGYLGTAAGITTYTFTPTGTLLGLLSGPTTFRISIFSVVATGGSVNSDGSNILWSSPVATVGNRNILNYPGVLLGLAAHTQCDPT